MNTKEKKANELKELEKIIQSIGEANVSLYEFIDKYRAAYLIDVANKLEQCTKELKENKIFSMPAPF